MKCNRHPEISSTVRINPQIETMDVLTDTKMPDPPRPQTYGYIDVP